LNIAILAFIIVIVIAILWMYLATQIALWNDRGKVIKESIEQTISAFPQCECEFEDLISVDIYKKNGALSCREAAKLGFSKRTRQFVLAWVSAPWDNAESDRQRSIIGIWGAGEISNVQIALNEEKSTFTSGKIEGRTGSALLGTMLFGIAGGIVGTAGKREISTQSHDVASVISLALEIQTTNPTSPYLYIHFFSAESSFDKMLDKDSADKRASIPLDQLRGRDEFQKAQKWYSILSSFSNEFSASPNNPTLISDELSRLHSLLKGGVITESEFSAAKERLIFGSERS